MPGVLAVFTGADLVAAGVKPLPARAGFKRADGRRAPRRRATRWRVGEVRFVGEAVAAVVAETREQARDAAEAVLVDYEELPHGGATWTTPPPPARRCCAPARRTTSPPRCATATPPPRAAAFAQAAHVVALDLVNQRLVAG